MSPAALAARPRRSTVSLERRWLALEQALVDRDRGGRIGHCDRGVRFAERGGFTQVAERLAALQSLEHPPGFAGVAEAQLRDGGVVGGVVGQGALLQVGPRDDRQRLGVFAGRQQLHGGGEVRCRGSRAGGGDPARVRATPGKLRAAAVDGWSAPASAVVHRSVAPPRRAAPRRPRPAPVFASAVQASHAVSSPVGYRWGGEQSKARPLATGMRQRAGRQVLGGHGIHRPWYNCMSDPLIIPATNPTATAI